MPLTQQQAEQFMKWLEQDVGVGTLRCEVCQNNDYSVDLILAIPQQTEGGPPGAFGAVSKGFDLAGPYSAFVTMACKRCGCAKFFDAGRAGIRL